MCGIFALAPSPNSPNNSIPQLAASLINSLKHRGPDDQGWRAWGRRQAKAGFADETTAYELDNCQLLMGQTRLSIIDLSPAGHQPMLSQDGRYTLVYNGEIYNYLELRQELEKLGSNFSSHTDSEVLFYALIHWGEGAFKRLTGMFAFIFYDHLKQTLLCARDPFGIKPLYYHYRAGGLCLASELPALMLFPQITRQVSAQQAYAYLRFGHYDQGGDTFLKDVYQIPPGHYFRFSLKNPTQPQIIPYWRPDLRQRSRLSFDEAAEELRAMFLHSVKLHLRSDVPLGVALSGGVDSSAVACAVRYLQPDAALHTFSFVASGSPVNEIEWARKIIKKINAIPHFVEVEPHELLADIDAMIAALGEPFGSTSIYAQRRVFQLARDNGIKVTVEGQGADELLAGYSGYPSQRIKSLLLAGNISGAWRFFRNTTTWPDRNAKEIFLRTVREFTPDFMVPLGLKLLGRSAMPAWLDERAITDSGIKVRFIDERQKMFPSRHKVAQILACQLTHNGMQQLLRHGDRNAMAFSIESRVPFLTTRMAEFCLSLPEEYLIDMQGQTKSVFRTAMRGLVPDMILDRRDKIGFATPECNWLTALSPWVEETLSTSSLIPYLRVDKARREWRAIKDGQAPFDWRVWRWLNYIRWVKLFNVNA